MRVIYQICWISILLLGLVASCSNEKPCPGLDPFCDRTAKATFKISPSVFAEVGDTIVVEADGSVYDAIDWYWNDVPISDCNGNDVCRLTMETEGAHTLKIRVKVDASGLTAGSEDKHQKTIYVSEPESETDDSASSYTVVLEDHFTDNTIDSGVWNLNDPGGRISEQNNRLEIDGSTGVAAGYMQSHVSISSDVAVGQASFNWTNPGINETVVRFRLMRNTANFAQIQTDDNGDYRLKIKQGGVNVYDTKLGTGSGVSTGITPEKNVKITYNLSTNEIKFWYWNGSWTQMGVTKYYDFGGAIHVEIDYTSSVATVNADLIVFDDVYLTQGDYSSSTP